MDGRIIPCTDHQMLLPIRYHLSLQLVGQWTRHLLPPPSDIKAIDRQTSNQDDKLPFHFFTVQLPAKRYLYQKHATFLLKLNTWKDVNILWISNKNTRVSSKLKRNLPTISYHDQNQDCSKLGITELSCGKLFCIGVKKEIDMMSLGLGIKECRTVYDQLTNRNL